MIRDDARASRMVRLGDTKALVGARRSPVAHRSLDQILKIPHTAAILARLAMLDVRGDAALTVDQRALLEAKQDAEERDELAAARPAGCWCYGRGGAGERAVLVPGQDVPFVLSVYCPCPEGQARQIADRHIREAGKAFEDQRRVSSIWDAAKVPERFDGCTLDTFPITTPGMRLVVNRIRNWIGTDEWALVLHGQYGVGKSGLSIGALRAAADSRQVGLYVKAPDLLTRVRATYGKTADVTELDVLSSLRTVPYLVLDDLGVGAEALNDWASTLLFQVIDDRHDNRRKTIVTTNLDIAGLAVHVGERTMHRFHEGAVFLSVEGPNLRKEKGA